jgi:hypothetical protein
MHMMGILENAPGWVLLLIISALSSIVGVLLAGALWGVKREISKFDISFQSLTEKLDKYVEVFTKATQDHETRISLIEEHCSPSHETRISILENNCVHRREIKK